LVHGVQYPFHIRHLPLVDVGLFQVRPSHASSLGVHFYFGLQAEHTLLGFMVVFVLFLALRLDGADSAWKRIR
jgi:hypothetical protein